MAFNLNKEDAKKIARKLGAITDTSTAAHDLAVIYHEGVEIASFGIRRGSQKETGHNHILSDIHVRPRQAKMLAQCPMSKEEWIDLMVAKQVIAAI